MCYHVVVAQSQPAILNVRIYCIACLEAYNHDTFSKSPFLRKQL